MSQKQETTRLIQELAEAEGMPETEEAVEEKGIEEETLPAEPVERPEEAEAEEQLEEPETQEETSDPFEVPVYLRPGEPRETDPEEAALEEGDEEEMPLPEGMEEMEDAPEEPEEPVMQEISFRDIPRKRKVRKKKHYLMRAFMIIGFLILIILVLLSPLFDIKHIKVEGNLYYTDRQVINMSGARTGQNIFLHAGAGAIKDSLGRSPYYADVNVHRRLPDTLVIQLDERPQVASLKFGEEYVIIDDKGLVLRVSPYMPKLTLLTGLTLSRIQVGEKIDAEEKLNLATTLDMINTMEEGDLFFKKISIGDLNIQAYIYDTLMVNGRPANIKRSIERGDLQKVVNKLYKSKTKRGIITVGDDDYLSFSPEF
ncbi:MAG: FtsQ-type POTRA domain-containing protein [Eubacterium sp.]|nr:FtsQ-type POTRA domain-containing protein [Eubacterium sp.]